MYDINTFVNKYIRLDDNYFGANNFSLIKGQDATTTTRAGCCAFINTVNKPIYYIYKCSKDSKEHSLAVFLTKCLNKALNKDYISIIYPDNFIKELPEIQSWDFLNNFSRSSYYSSTVRQSIPTNTINHIIDTNLKYLPEIQLKGKRSNYILWPLENYWSAIMSPNNLYTSIIDGNVTLSEFIQRFINMYISATTYRWSNSIVFNTRTKGFHRSRTRYLKNLFVQTGINLTNPGWIRENYHVFLNKLYNDIKKINNKKEEPVIKMPENVFFVKVPYNKLSEGVLAYTINNLFRLIYGPYGKQYLTFLQKLKEVFPDFTFPELLFLAQGFFKSSGSNWIFAERFMCINMANLWWDTMVNFKKDGVRIMYDYSKMFSARCKDEDYLILKALLPKILEKENFTKYLEYLNSLSSNTPSNKILAPCSTPQIPLGFFGGYINNDKNANIFYNNAVNSINTGKYRYRIAAYVHQITFK